MRWFPNKLKNLGLNLFRNNLGKNSENIKLLGQGMK